MKCLKRAKDSDSEDNFPKDNVNETCESDIEMEKDEVSIETACNSVEKSLELFDCSPLKNVKSDGTLQNVKRKISSVTSAFTKTIAIALVELVLDQDTECSNCSRMVELIKEKLSITKERCEIICLLTIAPNDFTISKIVEVFNVFVYSAKQPRELHCKKGI